MTLFTFAFRWKEELVCTCPLGSFILSAPMGVLSVYLPTQERWEAGAPSWARPLWPELHDQLGRWCAGQSVPLYVEDTGYADAYGFQPA